MLQKYGFLHFQPQNFPYFYISNYKFMAHDAVFGEIAYFL
jgi:hypothetical protein